MQVPVEWFAVSSGALIAMDSGTENMDWIADVLRGLIEFTQRGGEVNIVVTGINVGGQPYWNAEATMLMHTRGILVMTPTSAMVLTGKQALDFSGGVSAEDNFGIGGYDRVMGPNGQAQYWARDPRGRVPHPVPALRPHATWCRASGSRAAPTTRDPVDRDVRTSPHAAVPGTDHARGRRHLLRRAQPRAQEAVRHPLGAARGRPTPTASRSSAGRGWRDAETSVVWDAHVGGIPVCMLGLESRTLARRGYVPADGPVVLDAPARSSRSPRARRPGPSTRRAATGRWSSWPTCPASTGRRSRCGTGSWSTAPRSAARSRTSRGPIVFVVISRYHGGAFVVFSKRLNPSMEIAAVEGSYASVIGGAPAAATVFAREVRSRTENDPRVVELRRGHRRRGRRRGRHAARAAGAR